MIAELATAASLGLLTAVSPCPLATNVAAVSFLGRHAQSPRRSLTSGLAYVAGRTLCYTALAAILAAGMLAAATASAALGRYVGLLLGPVLVIAGALLLGLLPAPSFGEVGSGVRDALGKRGDALGAFALGVLFALSFCPSSAALFFGSLLPLTTRSGSVILVPVTYGIATGLPVLVFAVMVALGSRQIGRTFDRIKAVEGKIRLLTGLVLIGIGIYYCLRSNFGL
ncbi:MAG: sulfite exporter TauE/SafE family protein [Planctomycetes bacterium]|nr:sulfite exporter TauE/SafE family protein [Planctomycetota bacterium]